MRNEYLVNAFFVLLGATDFNVSQHKDQRDHVKIMARVKTPEENEVRYTAAAKALYGTVKRRPSSRA